jgi:type I restriction enzyme, S subunit
MRTSVEQTLGDILIPSRDAIQVEPEQAYPNIGIYSYARGVFAKAPIEGAATSASTLYRVRADQFIYSRLFAFEGAYAVVPAEFDGHFVSNEFPCFDCNPTKIHPGYLNWLFKRRRVWRDLAADSKGMGHRRQRVHPDRLLAYKVTLPQVSEQRRVAAKLDAVAAQIELLRRSTDVARAELNATLSSAFRKVIAGAPMVSMGDIAPLVRRPVVIDPDGSYPELGVRSFGKGTFRKPSLSGIEIGTKRLFEIHEGDLLFNIVFAWEGAVALASAADHGRVGSHRFLTCVPDPQRATSSFLLYYFLTPEGTQRLGAASPGGAGRNRTLGLKGLESIVVPAPSMDAQRWFDELQQKAAGVDFGRSDVARELDGLIPALLHQIFG